MVVSRCVCSVVVKAAMVFNAFLAQARVPDAGGAVYFSGSGEVSCQKRQFCAKHRSGTEGQIEQVRATRSHPGAIRVAQIQPRSRWMERNRSWTRFEAAVLIEAEQKRASDPYNRFGIPEIAGVPGMAILALGPADARTYGLDFTGIRRADDVAGFLFSRRAGY
jgi:hypothetical protein